MTGVGVTGLIQIIVMAAGIYFVFDLFKGTRSAQMLLGLVLTVAALIIVARLLQMTVLLWLFNKFPLFLAFAMVVIFQPEIRQVLAMIGRRRSRLLPSKRKTSTHIDSLVEAVATLAASKYGALIAYEREINLDGYRSNGTLLNAPLVPQMLTSIFFPNSPLHDGGVIIRDNTIVAARCIFPLLLTGNYLNFGMRHRAALGLSEETDAIVIVVSEESGNISLAFQGRLMQDITAERLARYLVALRPKEGVLESWRKILTQIDLGTKSDKQQDDSSGEKSVERRRNEG